MSFLTWSNILIHIVPGLPVIFFVQDNAIVGIKGFANAQSGSFCNFGIIIERRTLIY